MSQNSYQVTIFHARQANSGGSNRLYSIQAPTPEIAIEIAMNRSKNDNKNDTIFRLVSIK